MSKQNKFALSNIPADREGGKPSWVHVALVTTGELGKTAPIKLLPAWIALIAIACWPWSELRIPAAILMTLFLASDWILLAMLPVKKRSWGPVTPSLLGVTLLRTLIFWSALLGTSSPTMLIITTILNTLLSGLATYATWIEPFHLTTTKMHYKVSQWQTEDALKVLHISDLHFEGPSPREQQLMDKVRELKPDLILLTGDYLNLSSVHNAEAHRGAREILSHLSAPLGVYAVTGSPVVDVKDIVPEIFEGLPIQWLNNETVRIKWSDNTLWLLGLQCTYNEAQDQSNLKKVLSQVPTKAFTILLYHTPDLMPTAAECNVDLYLAGHTHGGQIRLPFYGAIATSSKWGKRYEMGMYHEGQTTLYVSRGLGLEGLGAPRARLLAPPEIILWEIGA